MSENFARIAFSRLSDEPPLHSVKFYDGYFAQLPPGPYSIEVTHQLQGTPENVQYGKQQKFTVRAPEFTIDPNTVMQAYPANGASDIYDQRLPFLVLADPGLPWERGLVPGSPPSTKENPLPPWLALVLFAEGEVYLQGSTNSPLATTQVSDLLEADPRSQTLKPTLPAGWVPPELMQSQCNTVTIPGATFNAVMPLATELPFLAHCRAVNSPHEDQLLHSVLLANRLPVADTATRPSTPRRYFAHLLSLEGFADYLGPAPHKTIPAKPGSKDLMDVQMVSLYNWTFVSMPETFLSFAELIGKLVASEADTQGALRLPPAAGLPPAAQSRLHDGYVALKFIAGSGDETFAWYRGPFSPVVPQALPPVGPAPGVPVAQATSADALMIYLAEQGLFDMSYAAAWNIGRNLALADAHFAQAVNRYVHAAKSAVATIAQRLALPHFGGEQEPRKLLARDASRRQFAELVGEGMGQQWTEALARARRGERPAHASRSRVRARPAPHARELWARPETAAAVGEHVAEQLDPVADWLANLGLLHPVPFSHLVPDPRLLPVESIRFFYVDPDWIDALLAGACSIAIHNSADAAAFGALHPQLTRAVNEKTGQRCARRYGDAAQVGGTGTGRIKMTGMLIRSELVSSWPTLVVAATLASQHVNLPRNDCPSKNVRLCLFDGVPDTVSLAEPYQGLLFGVEDTGIAPRFVSGDATQIGAPMNKPTVPPGGYSAFLTTYCRSADGGVIQIEKLASALGDATGVKVGSGFGAGDFAIQMVRAPEQQSFPPPNPR